MFTDHSEPYQFYVDSGRLPVVITAVSADYGPARITANSFTI